MIRVDFNVPIKNGKIGDDTRIRSSIPTIQYALEHGAKTVILCSHLGRPKGKVDPKYSLAPVAARLGELLGVEVPLAPGVADFIRPGSYLERQVRRFTELWEINQTRELPAVAEVAARLARHLPEPLPLAVVHGDYRLGNMMVAADDPARIEAILDWEMGAVGDPRADVGYLLATYSEPGGEVSPLGTSPVTTTPGFPSKGELVERYVERSGRQVEPLGWFQALALWKATVFCEAIYGRFIRGELAPEDVYAARFETGVPLLAQTALDLLSSAS